MGSLFSEISSRHYASHLSQSDADVRIEALEALQARRDVDLIVSKAIALLTDPEERVRLHAAEAIAAIGTAGAAESVIEAWEDFDDDGYDAAVEALAGIGRPAIALARKQLHHSRAGVRVAAAAALGRIDARTVDGDLAMALADPDPRVVAAAARALGNHGAEKCIDDLTVVYRRVPAAREAVVDALATIGTPAALRRLEPAIDDEDPNVAERARAALARAEAA